MAIYSDVYNGERFGRDLQLNNGRVMIPEGSKKLTPDNYMRPNLVEHEEEFDTREGILQPEPMRKVIPVNRVTKRPDPEAEVALPEQRNNVKYLVDTEGNQYDMPEYLDDPDITEALNSGELRIVSRQPTEEELKNARRAEGVPVVRMAQKAFIPYIHGNREGTTARNVAQDVIANVGRIPFTPLAVNPGGWVNAVWDNLSPDPTTNARTTFGDAALGTLVGGGLAAAGRGLRQIPRNVSKQYMGRGTANAADRSGLDRAGLNEQIDQVANIDIVEPRKSVRNDVFNEQYKNSDLRNREISAGDVADFVDVPGKRRVQTVTQETSGRKAIPVSTEVTRTGNARAGSTTKRTGGVNTTTTDRSAVNRTTNVQGNNALNTNSTRRTRANEDTGETLTTENIAEKGADTRTGTTFTAPTQTTQLRNVAPVSTETTINYKPSSTITRTERTGGGTTPTTTTKRVETADTQREFRITDKAFNQYLNGVPSNVRARVKRGLEYAKNNPDDPDVQEINSINNINGLWEYAQNVDDKNILNYLEARQEVMKSRLSADERRQLSGQDNAAGREISFAERLAHKQGQRPTDTRTPFQRNVDRIPGMSNVQRLDISNMSPVEAARAYVNFSPRRQTASYIPTAAQVVKPVFNTGRPSDDERFEELRGQLIESKQRRVPTR